MAEYKIYNGDCLEVMDRLIEEDIKVDTVITSPPYNIGKEYEKKQDFETYLKWLKNAIEKISLILNNDGVLILNVGKHIDKDTNAIPISFEIYNILKKYGFKLRQNIIWMFNSGLNCKKRLSGRHEEILWLYKGDKLPTFNLEDIRVKEWKAFDKRNNPNGKNPTDVWHFEPIKGNSKEKKGHPCQFPLSMIDRIVKGMTNENDLVLDCFMGSGTTGVACLKNNRNFIGVELDEKYFEIAKNRIENLENN